MLPYPARNAIISELPQEYWMDVGEGAFPDSPNASEWRIIPEYRWQYQDFEEATPPYEHVTLISSEESIPESGQPVDLVIDEAPASDTADADIVTHRGRWVYDIIEMRVTTEGSETRDGLTLTDTDRARGLCEGAYKWLLYKWQSAPLDAFDSQGNSITQPDVKYGDELSPPVRVDPIPARSPTNTTEAVDANGAQYNAAVELHYVDGVFEYEYKPESAETNVGIVE